LINLILFYISISVLTILVNVLLFNSLFKKRDLNEGIKPKFLQTTDLNRERIRFLNYVNFALVICFMKLSYRWDFHFPKMLTSKHMGYFEHHFFEFYDDPVLIYLIVFFFITCITTGVASHMLLMNVIHKDVFKDEKTN
jgi:hypothetical protein